MVSLTAGHAPCDDSNKWENPDATCLPRLSGPGGDVKPVAEVQVEAERLPAQKMEAAVKVQEPAPVHIVVHHLMDKDILEFIIRPLE